MKRSQVTGSQIGRGGERLQRRAAARELPVHRLRQGARRRQRALLDIGVLALVRINDEQRGGQGGRQQDGQHEPDELRLDFQEKPAFFVA